VRPDPHGTPPPVPERLAPMLAQRADLLARVEHVEAENRKLRASLNMGAGPRLLQSQAGVAALLLVFAAGFAGGFFAGRAQQSADTMMNGTF
jgi:hypothetical protein